MDGKVREALGRLDGLIPRGGRPGSIHGKETQAWATIRAHIEGLEADAARYRWLRDHACNQLILSRDEGHATNYMTAAEWIEDSDEFMGDPPEAIEAMKAANTIWALQVYPNTPIGFWVIHRATLDEAIDLAIAEANNAG